METMKYYHDLYLKSGILLLGDVFEKFSNNNLSNYGLCPSHHMSAPDLSRDAMLEMAKLNLNVFQILTCIYSFKKV